MDVDEDEEDAEFMREYDGKTYYFCSESSEEQFVRTIPKSTSLPRRSA
jgi:YHS domain-containing protein